MKRIALFLVVVVFAVLIAACSDPAQKAESEPVPKPTPEPTIIPEGAIETETITLKNIGVTLNEDIATTGGFSISMLAEEDGTPITKAATAPAIPTLDAIKASLEKPSCVITAPSSMDCSCLELSVIKAEEKLAIAIIIDSSGSNITGGQYLSYGPEYPPSDPTNLRLEAAKTVLDVLLVNNNKAAIFVYGTKYCGDNGCLEADDNPNYYQNLPYVGERVRLAYGFDTATKKDEMKKAVEKAVWYTNDGTPTYTALRDVSKYMNTELTDGDAAKVIILITDGFPQDDNLTRHTACSALKYADIKLFTIGYGPSSVNSDLTVPQAVAEVEALASCGSGSYLPSESVEQITQELSDLGSGLIAGRLETKCKLPVEKLADIAGAMVAGKIKLKFWKEESEKSIPFSFGAPIPVKSTVTKTKAVTGAFTTDGN